MWQLSDFILWNAQLIMHLLLGFARETHRGKNGVSYFKLFSFLINVCSPPRSGLANFVFKRPDRE